MVLGPDKATETQEVSLGARMNRFSDLGKNRDLTKAVQLTCKENSSGLEPPHTKEATYRSQASQAQIFLLFVPSLQREQL